MSRRAVLGLVGAFVVTAVVASLLLRLPTYEGIGLSCPLQNGAGPTVDCPGPLLTWSDAIGSGIVAAAVLTAAVALAFALRWLSERLRERRGSATGR
jgi:hypothetical protein